MRSVEIKYLTKILDKVREDVRFLQHKAKGAEWQAKHESLLNWLTFLRQNSAFRRLLSDEHLVMLDEQTALVREQWDDFDEFITFAKNGLRLAPIQYKVVFFPYAASTWDSLKSIYKAFARDERFITDVVIIPTYRTSPTGRLSLYEDFLADTEIPHTSYTDYDLAEDKPDIAFVNNSYDQVVESEFQAARFRQYCKMLVYVPYYGVTNGFVKKFKPKIYDQSIHQVADKLIVQSDIVAQAYNIHCKRSEKRYLPLGTPKIDSLKEEVQKCALDPKREWLTRFAGRKVFLLDTHYNTPIWQVPLPNKSSYNYLFLLLEAFLNFFADHQDIFLLWRPHPLNDKMVANFNAGKFKYYMEALLKLKKVGEELPNCIIDNEENANMAMAVSDAFISLGGSLRYLYPALQKPVIYSLYKENDEIFFPPGDKYMIADNDICYVPRSNKLLSFIGTYAAKGDIHKSQRLQSEERSLLGGVSAELKGKYYELIEKIKHRQCFTDDFWRSVKHTAPSPAVGYMQAALAFNSVAILPEIKEEWNLFGYYLTKEQTTLELTGYIDMIAKSQDPMREQHYDFYKQAVANIDKNCGETVHQAISDDFLIRQNPPPLVTGGKINNKKHSKKHSKNR